MIGILFAIFAGVMLGFYAMPEKFVKNYAFENTWGLCFLFMLWVVPFFLAFTLIDSFGQVLGNIGTPILFKMLIPSFLWGVGMLLWGKAINHIGLSLGFSIFIGTIVFIGSLLPFFIYGLPVSNVLVTIMFGISVILAGIILNGRAGILREGQKANGKGRDSSMMVGIIIAVVGGLLCTGFNVANEFGKNAIAEAIQKTGNESWLTSVASMFIVYVSGGLFVIPYMVIQISRKKMWKTFKVDRTGKNISMTALMAALNFTASIMFAYSAFVLGKAGGTIGYAIFNTMSVVVAVIGGIATKEWVSASGSAKISLYLGLAGMVLGVLIIAFGNSLNA